MSSARYSTHNQKVDPDDETSSVEFELDGTYYTPPPAPWIRCLPLQLRRRSIPSHWPWMVSTGLLSALCVFLSISGWRSRPVTNSYEHGFDTDLDAAFPALEIERIPFTGGLHWNENGTLVRNPLPDGREWVGPPSPELDARWDHVVDAAGVDVVGKEADMVRGKTRQRPTGEYITGLDVFHQLHCLNKVRQALYPEYYHDSDGPEIKALHVDHCIDYIRQAIMCNADMSTVYVVYSPAADRWSPNFEREHTCRNFKQLLNWSLDRLHPGGEEDLRSGHGHHHSR